LTTLQEILSAREERQLLRQQASAGGKLAVSLNLNIPGHPKTSPIYKRFFNSSVELLKTWLLANRIQIHQENELLINHAAGDFYLVNLKSEDILPAALKQITEEFEQNHQLGRFIDVDISDKNGVPVSSGKHKVCFFCNTHPAVDCIHHRRHTISELRNYQQKEMLLYLKEERINHLSRKICSFAIRSIFYELSLSPKPGLVTAVDSGIHTDMDFRTFIDSTAVISTYFDELFRKGTECEAADLWKALSTVRKTGLLMEKEMFIHTKGVNTQKGIIFLMGISLFSAGYVLKEHDTFNQDLFISTVKQICKGLVENESGGQANSKTHGERCFQLFQTGGIRSEAEQGFPTVFGHTLPVLIAENNTGADALYKTLIAAMSVLDDTNILFRSDRQTLKALQDLCKPLPANFSMAAYLKISDFCRQNRISPGGSADILSITIFIFLLKTELKQ